MPSSLSLVRADFHTLLFTCAALTTCTHCSDRPKWTLAHDVPVRGADGGITALRFEPLCSYRCVSGAQAVVVWRRRV